ncbi:hypothetical protein HOH45_07940 [bacterium]|jgi:lipopolysaccharide transport protein LptA|nr:hypothetical protein [bacterium]
MHKILTFLIVILVSAAVGSNTLNAQSDGASETNNVSADFDIVITADVFELDGLTNEFVASGNVRVIQEDIVIVGDKATFDKDKNLIQLFGNIELKKGKMNITCKTLNAYGKKQKIKAFGGVNFNYEDIKGSCEIAEYDTKSQLLVLNGDAEAWQFGNRLNGDRIFIDLKGQKIRTQGKAKVKLIMKEERKEDQK